MATGKEVVCTTAFVIIMALIVLGFIHEVDLMMGEMQVRGLRAMLMDVWCGDHGC